MAGPYTTQDEREKAKRKALTLPWTARFLSFALCEAWRCARYRAFLVADADYLRAYAKARGVSLDKMVLRF